VSALTSVVWSHNTLICLNQVNFQKEIMFYFNILLQFSTFFPKSIVTRLGDLPTNGQFLHDFDQKGKFLWLLKVALKENLPILSHCQLLLIFHHFYPHSRFFKLQWVSWERHFLRCVWSTLKAKKLGGMVGHAISPVVNVIKLFCVVNLENRDFSQIFKYKCWTK